MPMLTKMPVLGGTYPIFNQLSQELNRFWDRDVSALAEGKPLWNGDFAPAVDIRQEKDHYLIKADIPGIDAKAMKVTVVNNTLTLEGERESERETKSQNYAMKERQFGSFYRSFTLPLNVEASRITAKHQNGVLTIVLPFVETEKSKAVEVRIE